MIYILVLVLQNLHVNFQNPIENLLLLRILSIPQLKGFEEFSKVEF